MPVNAPSINHSGNPPLRRSVPVGQFSFDAGWLSAEPMIIYPVSKRQETVSDRSVSVMAPPMVDGADLSLGAGRVAGHVGDGKHRH
jgi:hypothetical protein